MAGTKRIPNVPREARLLGEQVSKADLLEVAWRLASTGHAGGCDDNEGTLRYLVDLLNLERAIDGRLPVKLKAVPK